MPMPLQVGQKGTLKFEAAMAGFDPEQITDIKWSQQGSPQAVKFTQPDQVEGVAVGSGSFKCSVTQKPEAGGQPQHSTYNFTVECVDMSAPAKMVPVSISAEPPSAPPPPGAR